MRSSWVGMGGGREANWHYIIKSSELKGRRTDRLYEAGGGAALGGREGCECNRDVFGVFNLADTYAKNRVGVG